MIYAMLKFFFINQEPKFFNYTVYKTFSFETFKKELSNGLGSSSDSFDEF